MTISTLISHFKDDARMLLESRVSLLKLRAIERGVPVAVSGAYSALLILLVLLILPLVIITGALALGLIFATPGDSHNTVLSIMLGFGCVTAFFLLILLLLALLRQPITRAIIGGMSNKMLDGIEAEATKSDQDRDSSPDTLPAAVSADSLSDDTAVLRVAREDRIYREDDAAHQQTR